MHSGQPVSNKRSQLGVRLADSLGASRSMRAKASSALSASPSRSHAARSCKHTHPSVLTCTSHGQH